ncbi:calcium-binding protein [Crenalkalicoccus roseus]|uniref:calcium-binding protein n=1 Tax=Crenalkalicoccus roseus TaxID=1485588 RepID=UPI001081C8F5|nr:calcium-binding protein [Crenalkalicoccus roseus]
MLIIGTSADDMLWDTPEDDEITGGGGNDTLVSAAGQDTLDGGAGRNTASFAGREAGVTVLLEAGLELGSGTRLLNIHSLIGSSFDDVLIGDAGANWLFGGDGDDYIEGGGGNDTLVGGAGENVLTGGTGADLFVFHAGQAQGDIVTDFNALEGDRLLFLGYGSLAGGARFEHIGGFAWEIRSWDGLIVDVITLANGAMPGLADWTFG